MERVLEISAFYGVKGTLYLLTTTYMVAGDCQVLATTYRTKQSWVKFVGCI